MRLTASNLAAPDPVRREFLRGMVALGAAGLLGPAFAQAATAPALVGGDSAVAWPSLARLIHALVDPGKLPGLVATTGWRDEPLQSLAAGTTAFGGKAPVTLDSLYRIYSMSKPVTGLVAASLIDRGRMTLDTPIADILPELATMQVALDPAKGLAARPAAVPITVRHLLTHTAGLGYSGIGQDACSMELLRRGLIGGYITRRRISGVTPGAPLPPLPDYLRQLAEVPLVAEPGTKWRYSMGLDVLGIAMARLEGKTLGALMHECVFDPAGMSDTWFQVPKDQLPRLTTNYGFAHGLHVALDKPETSLFADPQPIEFGGGGLVSSPRDFDRFMRLMLNDGMIGGKQAVSAAAVKLATSNLLPSGADLVGTNVEGAGFGAGGRVGLGVDQGSFGWSGAAGTIFFVQRRIGLRAAIYAQYMPSTHYTVQKDFLTAVRTDALAGNKQ